MDEVFHAVPFTGDASTCADKCELPSVNEVIKWTEDDVTQWLAKIHLETCIPAFQKRQIDGSALLRLTKEEFLFWNNEVKMGQRRQITKYINQCKRKDMTLRATRKRLSSLVQSKKYPSPPEPIPPDYTRGDSDDDAGYEWDTDFDDDDEESDQREQETFHNDESTTDTSGDWQNHDKSELHQTPNGVAGKIKSLETLNLPVQPEIPCRTKPKISNGGAESVASGSSTSGSSENLRTLNAANSNGNSTPGILNNNKPAVLPKPTTLLNNRKNSAQQQQQKPVLNVSLGFSLPRPPGSFPRQSPPRTVRPTEQPPPPPVDRKDEYEIPNSCSSDANSTTSSGNVFNDSASLFEHYDKVDGSDDGDDHSQWSTNSSSSTSESRHGNHIGTPLEPHPLLPPKNSQSSPPPLPQKPAAAVAGMMTGCGGSGDSPSAASPKSSASTFATLASAAVAKTLNRKSSSSSPVPLPTRVIPSSGDESGGKPKGERKSSLKDKLSSLLLTKPNSNAGGSYSDTALPKQSSRLSSPRSSIDEGSVQKRPLPPLPETKEPLETFKWFHKVEREVAELKLKESNRDGCYIVRPSRRAGEGNPYTLSILYMQKVFHLNIRMAANNKFALGKEKPNEKVFNSVVELISFHQTEAIILTSKGMNAGATKLLITPARR